MLLEAVSWVVGNSVEFVVLELVAFNVDFISDGSAENVGVSIDFSSETDSLMEELTLEESITDFTFEAADFAYVAPSLRAFSVDWIADCKVEVPDSDGKASVKLALAEPVLVLMLSNVAFTMD